MSCRLPSDETRKSTLTSQGVLTLRSMTGFGRAQAELDGLTIRVAVRSVNNRFLKVTVKLPEAWQTHQLQLESAA